MDLSIFSISHPLFQGVAGEVILFHFGWVGFLVGGCVSAVIDINNLISVIQKESYSTESFLTSPLMQIVASGVLVFIAQMNMNVLFKIETAAVGMLLQTTTSILFAFAFQILLYKVISYHNTMLKMIRFQTGV